MLIHIQLYQNCYKNATVGDSLSVASIALKGSAIPPAKLYTCGLHTIVMQPGYLLLLRSRGVSLVEVQPVFAATITVYMNSIAPRIPEVAEGAKYLCANSLAIGPEKY